MKKNEIVSLIIIFILLIAILFGAIYLGGRHRLGGKVPEPVTPNEYAGYLYCQIDGVMMRYDPQNDTAVKLCGHTDEDVYCILEHTAPPTRISDGRVYFGYLSGSEDAKYYIAYYDIESGKTQDTGIEYSPYRSFFVYDGYIYYNDSKNLLRQPADGGEVESLAECDYSEYILMVADGKIYTYSGNFSISSSIINTAHIYSYDLETSQKKDIYSFRTYTSDCINKAEYHDGKIYISIDTAEIISAKPSLSSQWRFDYVRLYVIDTKSDECDKLLETQVGEFFLKDNKIVYFPYTERAVISDAFSGYPQALCGESIHECDLDGKNDKIIYTNPDIAFLEGYLSGDKLFGSFADSSPGTENELFYASLNLATGEINKVVLPE
ncbi:MAG: hypothetical protein IJD70_04680 [Clostridia bacterium]|nr:hypothetical protein [Clostridia bacterium]